MVGALDPQFHRPAQPLNELVAHRRYDRHFEEVRQSLQRRRGRRGSWSLVRHRVAHECRLSHLWNRIGKLHRVQPLIETALAQQFFMRSHFDHPAAIQHDDTVGILNR